MEEKPEKQHDELMEKFLAALHEYNELISRDFHSRHGDDYDHAPYKKAITEIFDTVPDERAYEFLFIILKTIGSSGDGRLNNWYNQLSRGLALSLESKRFPQKNDKPAD